LSIEAMAEVEATSTPARSQSEMEILKATSGFFYELELEREVYADFGAKRQTTVSPCQVTEPNHGNGISFGQKSNALGQNLTWFVLIFPLVSHKWIPY